MVIDLLVAVLLALAVWKGFSKGLVVAIFSFLAILIGLAAAMKFSLLVAGWLKSSTNLDGSWLPILSFVLVLLAVALLIRIGARLIQKTLQVSKLGWADR